MSHFAKVIDGVVDNIIVAEQDFIDTFIDDTPGDWIQTSYNTRGGKHYGPDNEEDDGTPFRKNFAIIGGGYDYEAEAFYPPKPYDSWLLNEDTYLWEAPIDPPEDYDGGNYLWNEESGQWNAVEE